MDNQQQKSFFDNPREEENSLVDILHRYLVYWKWFVVGIFCTSVCGFLYIRYKTPKYEASASILIKDDKKGAGISELSAFDDLGIFPKSNSIDNDIEILKSRSLMTLVARELRLNVRYYIEREPIREEKFNNSPVYLRFLAGDSTIEDVDAYFVLTAKSNTQFELRDEKSEKKGVYTFGQEFSTPYGKAAIFASVDLKKEGLIDKEITITVAPISAVVDEYRELIKIDPANKTSNVILITLKGTVREKAEAVINSLIKQHNADAIADKNLVSKNTADFINERIRYITAELSTVEGEVEDFKTRHGLVDVESEAKLFLETSTASELSILEASTQKALSDYMYEYITKHSDPADLIPANLGLADEAVGLMIAEHNRFVLERNRILRSSGEKNPVAENLTEQIVDLRKSIKESLFNLQSSLQIKIRELNKQESGISSRIATVPKYEREYRMIQRQQQIKETLYLYLLQKREETNIALAVTVANAKIIDSAYSNSEPVSPKKKVVYLVAVLLGLILPAIALYIKDLLDSKVHGKRDIDKIGVPFIGDIPQALTKERIVVSKGENTSVAEAFRLLRTNVDFMLGSKVPGRGRTIFLTSTLSKEGKSFTAMNLAISIAISGKKVLLIGMDVRAPKLLEYFDLDDKFGLTNYISSDEIALKDVIMKAPGIDNLNILPSGSIPPNPSELLMSPKISEMFETVRGMYDYVIVDTAPIGMVTDTLLLSDYADAFIYVVRAYYLDRRLLSVAEDLYKEKRLPNMAILINGTDKEKGYGYGYGYGYGGYGYGHEKQRPRWKKILGIK